MKSTPIALDLHDVGLRWARSASTDPGRVEIGEPSPGLALYRKGRLDIGAHARSVARIYPKDVADAFWQQLSTDALGAPFPADWTLADLVHAHLESLWAEARENTGDAGDGAAILVSSGAWADTQLGLLSGIAQSLEMPLAGLVDRALASILGWATERQGVGESADPRLSGGLRRLVHLDLELHRAVVTAFELAPPVEAGGEWGLRRVDRSSAEGVGLDSLLRRFADHVAEVFVRTTRFDPRHRGDREQQLYDHLPSWLDALGDGEATIAVLPGGELADAGPSVELDRPSLLAAAEPELASLAELLVSAAGGVESARVHLLLASTATAIPGLVDRVSAHFLGGTSRLAAETAVLGALGLAPELSEQLAAEPRGVPYRVDGTLPSSLFGDSDEGRREPSAVPSAFGAGPERVGPAPTHVLWRGVAHPLSPEPLIIGLEAQAGSRALALSLDSATAAGISRRHASLRLFEGEARVEDHSSYGTWLDGVRITREARLGVGSRLRLGTPGVELELIRVLSTPSAGGKSED